MSLIFALYVQLHELIVRINLKKKKKTLLR